MRYCKNHYTPFLLGLLCSILLSSCFGEPEKEPCFEIEWNEGAHEEPTVWNPTDYAILRTGLRHLCRDRVLVHQQLRNEPRLAEYFSWPVEQSLFPSYDTMVVARFKALCNSDSAFLDDKKLCNETYNSKVLRDPNAGDMPADEFWYALGLQYPNHCGIYRVSPVAWLDGRPQAFFFVWQECFPSSFCGRNSRLLVLSKTGTNKWEVQHNLKGPY